MAYHRYHGVKTRIVRIFNTYGPRMRLNDGRVLPNFMKQALRGEPITIYGQGQQTRSFCYVSDLVEGIVRLLNTDFSEPVNLGNPNEITVMQLAEEIIAWSQGTKSKIVHEGLPEDDPKRRKPDITRAQNPAGLGAGGRSRGRAQARPRVLPRGCVNELRPAQRGETILGCPRRTTRERRRGREDRQLGCRVDHQALPIEVTCCAAHVLGRRSFPDRVKAHRLSQS